MILQGNFHLKKITWNTFFFFFIFKKFFLTNLKYLKINLSLAKGDRIIINLKPLKYHYGVCAYTQNDFVYHILV